MAAAAQEEQWRQQQQEEEERQRLAAEEAKNVRAVQDAQQLRRLEACRAALLDHKLLPLSIDDQVALKEHAVKLKLPPEACLNRCEQKLKNLITSKMQPEKLMKVTEEILLYPPGPDRTLLEQMRPEDRLWRTQFMLQDAASTACKQVSDGSTVNKVLQRLQETYKDYINTITLLVDADGWEREKLVEFKSGAQDLVRTAKADLKRMEKDMKGHAAQRGLDRTGATVQAAAGGHRGSAGSEQREAGGVLYPHERGVQGAGRTGGGAG